MPARGPGALIAAGLLGAVLVAGAATAPAPAATLEHVGTYVWTAGEDGFGGFSGLEISPDGNGFHAVTDRAQLFWGSVERDNSGRIRGLNIAGRSHLKDSKATPLKPGLLGDSEGLAVGPDGRIWVSFEGLDRLALYAKPDLPAERLPTPPVLAELKINAGMEALAMAPDGALIALPERSGKADRPFPVLRYREDQGWDAPWEITREGSWLPVGADFGPDGRFYLLERDFLGVLGFSSRIRRFDFGPDGPTNGEVLLETRSLQYDNLEGIAVWQDGLDLRITMISDDNFLFVQRTELVEYRLRD